MNIEWKDSYCIGDEHIDRQHQELFALANTMLEARDQAALRLCAVRLYKHVREHFADEELLMKRVGFPQYQQHAASHIQLLSGLNAISQDIASNTIYPSVVAAFLNDWGLKHIPNADAEVARYVLAKVHPYA
jgi:hemerythrin-like metal-binding protein